MKRLISILFSVFAVLAAGLSVVSCTDRGWFDDDSYHGNTNHNHRYPNGGGNGNGGNGNGGDNGGGGGQTQPVFPGDKTYQLKADAVYYGDQNFKDVDEFVLYLYWGEYDEDGLFKTEGTELAFDVICKKNSGMKLVPGTYNCTSDDITPGHFLDGYEDEDMIYPSYAYYQFSKKDGKTAKITAGNMTIYRSGDDKYSVKIYFSAEGPYVNSAKSYLVQYEGEIPIVDGRDNGSEPDDKVGETVEMKSISKVVVENWGQIWTDNDGKVLPVSDWILYLYGPNADKDNEYAMIELLMPADAKSIAPGLYNDVIALGDLGVFKAGAVLAGYTDGDDNIAYGTWYCKGGTAYYAATKGQLAVAVKGDTYSLNFDFVDEDETYGGAFKGSYTGKVEYVDQTVDTKAGASRGKLQKKIHKNPATSRNVKAARCIYE